MDAVSQHTRSKKVLETQNEQETQEAPDKVLQKADLPDTRWDHAVRDSLDDRMDNYIGAMLYTAIHYPRFFVALWVLVLVVLSVLAVSTQAPSA
jgi:hypothetical protein